MDKRSEPRVAHQIRFVVDIHECREAPATVGQSVDCQAIDFSRHGLQFQTDETLIPGSLLGITIGIGEPPVTYRLQGEIRWVRAAGGSFATGILLKEAEGTDFAKWESSFEQILG